MRQVVNTEEEWHKLRAQCITASEAAVLVGMDPYGSPGKLKKENDFKDLSYRIEKPKLSILVIPVYLL